MKRSCGGGVFRVFVILLLEGEGGWLEGCSGEEEEGVVERAFVALPSGDCGCSEWFGSVLLLAKGASLRFFCDEARLRGGGGFEAVGD